MNYKTLSLLLLSASAMAAPQDDNNNSDIANLKSIASQLEMFSSLPTGVEVPGVPSSVVEVFATAIPSTWLQNVLTNSAVQSSVINDLESSKYPDWWSSVPTDVQSYAWDLDSSLSASATPTSGSATTSTGSSATATSTSDSDSDSDDDSSDDSSSSPSSSSSGTAASDTSEGAAPIQTGMAATVAGAAGILGLALAL